MSTFNYTGRKQLERSVAEFVLKSPDGSPLAVYFNNALSDLKEFHEIYCAIQYNYNKDENGVLRFVDGREDVILFTFREEEDGNITITDTRFAEEGEKAAASLEEMCREINAPYDDALEMLNFDRAYDVQDLIEYMDQNPDVTGIEYEGQVRTYEELKEIGDQRLRELYPEDFTESSDEPKTETP